MPELRKDNKIIKYKNRKTLLKSIRKNRFCCSCIAKVRSDSKEFKKKASERMIGEKNIAKREDVKRKLSEINSGLNNPMYGKHMTEERKLFFSEKWEKRQPII